MIKYTGHYITFQEVPNEVSLTLAISGCPHRCPGCHSPWLQKDTGDVLTVRALFLLMAKYADAITCVCFMGDGGDLHKLEDFIRLVHLCGFKACVYSGNQAMESGYWDNMDCFPDYYKIGPYIESRGGLEYPNTNQRMYFIARDGEAKDITHLFWKEKA